MRLKDPVPTACSSDGCSRQATIVHHGQPYCGKHALAKLDAGESADHRNDAPRTGRSAPVNVDDRNPAVLLPQLASTRITRTQ